MHRYTFQPPALTGDIEGAEEAIRQLSKHAREGGWERGHLFIETLDDEGSGAPQDQELEQGGSEQSDTAAPENSSGGLERERSNVWFAAGDVIYDVEVPSVLRGIRWRTHRPTEGSDESGFVQVRVRDWEGEVWLGPVLSSLEGELHKEDVQDLDIPLEPGAALGGVYARIGAGPVFHPTRGNLQLLISRR